MGETTCLVQPFSYAAGMSSNEATEGNRFHALGQSVSFGRFMSESLSWEKWSTFSHNRYVEEAERYSRPGSVAQMKAFFEAHYKNVAARKAAALLEQANSAANNVPEPQHEGVIHDNVTQDSSVVTKNSEEDADKRVHVEDISTEPEARSDDIEGNNQVKKVDPPTVDQVLVENAIKIEPSSQLGVVDDKEEVKEMDLVESKQMEKPLLKDFMSNEEDSASMSKKKHPVSSTKSLIHGRASKLSSSPAKPAASLGARRENIATPICRKSAIEHLDRKKSTPKSTHKSMNFTPVRELNRITSTIIRKIDGSRACSSSKASKDFPTPLRTPTTVFAPKKPKQPLATPLAENRRAKTPLQASASGGRTVRPRWNFLPTRELAAAAKARGGVDVGLYLSPWDRHDRRYGHNLEYNEYYLAQLQELLNEYGSVREIWFDGAKGPNAPNMSYYFSDWFAMVKELQSSINIFSDAGPDVRWIGDENGFAGSTCWSTINRTALSIGNESIVHYLSTGDPKGTDWLPAECDVSIRPGWFWHKSESPKKLSQLLEIYYNSVGRNCVLLLNVPPNTTGLISDVDVHRLKEFRKAIDTIFSSNLAEKCFVKASSRRGGKDGGFGPENVLDTDHLWTYWAPSDGRKDDDWVEFICPDGLRFNVIRIQEAIGLGQRIERHEIYVDGKKVADGTTVGHKRLHKLEKGVEHGQNVRIKILESRGLPLISSIGLHYDPFWHPKEQSSL